MNSYKKAFCLVTFICKCKRDVKKLNINYLMTKWVWLRLVRYIESK